MSMLQDEVRGFLEAAGFGIIEARDGFLVADRQSFGGDREIRLLWVPPTSERVDDFPALERNLLTSIRAETPRYLNPRGTIVTANLEGFSRDFRAEVQGLGVSFRVPVQFFDAPFTNPSTIYLTFPAADGI